MLSRTADSLYWLGRYMERAGNTARALQVALAEAAKRKSRQSEISKEVARLESRGKD